MRFVAGAETSAADTRLLRTKAQIAATAMPAHTTPIVETSTSYQNAIEISNVTFNNLSVLSPFDNTTQTGAKGIYYYFPGYFTQDVNQQPIVAAGSISDPNEAKGPHTYNPGDHVSYFAQGATFAPNTVLKFPDGTTYTFDGTASANISVTTQSGDQFVAATPGKGNLHLNDPIFPQASTPIFSVVRTGTGNLEMLAAGDLVEQTPYSIYTAGTQTPGVAGTYNSPRAVQADGTVLGSNNFAQEALLASYQANYPSNGGNLLINVQGDLTRSYAETGLKNSTDRVGNWLWRQGGADLPTAWWINYGTFVAPLNSNGTLVLDGSGKPVAPQFVGFQGIGALGGGVVEVDVGGDVVDATTSDNDSIVPGALVIASGGTGRLGDGGLLQTGGGDITLRVDGNSANVAVVDLRGDTTVDAGSVGAIYQSNSLPTIQDIATTLDPRYISKTVVDLIVPGLYLEVGDGTVSVNARGELALGGVADPGRVTQQAAVGVGDNSQLAWFSLWTDKTAVNLFGGKDVSPISGTTAFQDANPDTPLQEDGTAYYPASFSAVADGDIMVQASFQFAQYGGFLELAPSQSGALTLIAGASILDQSGTIFAQSGADPDIAIATPQKPGYLVLDDNGLVLQSNFWGTSPTQGELFNFGPDNADGSSQNPQVRAYAIAGDITGLRIGAVADRVLNGVLTTRYIGASGVQERAGRDIVDAGEIASDLLTRFGGDEGSFFVNQQPSDVSVISAGRDIFYANALVAGPGTLEVSAGRNLYQGDVASIESLGPLTSSAQAIRTGGANVVAIAGVGANGPDYQDFGELYLNPANQADPSRPLADQPGKVVKTYQDELYAWLQRVYGYSGTEDQALAYFEALPTDQQAVFLNQVYFDELRASGREFTNPDDQRYKSYLRGRDAIAVLFPDKDAAGNAITYDGDLTMFSGFTSITGAGGVLVGGPPALHDAGIHTDFGGAIQILTPGGATTLGTEGLAPGLGTGLLTQGSGDIDVYALDSIALGLSRVFTTFGGNIVMWSATGDINSGRGAKTSVVFTPPRVTYDDYGNLALAPTVPSTGAGIATLAPIPEVPPGDIDLIAPLGTVDAGEAGIRVSGNINIAALHVQNAANIQVQGTATGIPKAATPNIGALTTASNTAGQAAAAATQAASQSRNRPMPQDLPSIITVEVIGYGGGDGVPNHDLQNDGSGGSRRRPAGQQSGSQSQDPNSPVQVIGGGKLTPEQQEKLTATEVRNFNAP